MKDKTFQNYLPLSHSIWLQIAVIISGLSLYLNASNSSFGQAARLHFPSLFNHSSVAFALVVIFLWLFSRLLNPAYWRRNVIGYTAIYWLGDEGEMQIDIRPRGKVKDWFRSRNKQDFALYLNLGGWLRRPQRLTEWSCRLGTGLKTRLAYPQHYAGWKIRWIKERGQYGTGVTFPTVRITDEYGNSLQLNLNRALVLLIYNNLLSDPSTNLMGFTDVLFDHANQIPNLQLIARNGERQENQLLEIIYETVTRLYQTKRFQKSKEGQDIRQWLTEQAMKMLPQGDSRRERLLGLQTASEITAS